MRLISSSSQWKSIDLVFNELISLSRTAISSLSDFSCSWRISRYCSAADTSGFWRAWGVFEATLSGAGRESPATFLQVLRDRIDLLLQPIEPGSLDLRAVLLRDANFL